MALFKSTNGGSSWSTHIIRSDSSAAYTVEVDPLNTNTIYVGGVAGSSPKLHKSVNGGSSWSEIGSGTLSGILYDIAVDPSATNRVLVGTSAGIYRSDDGGSSWSKKHSVSTATILIPKVLAETAYAGGTGGVYQSDDGGNTWQTINSGLVIKNVMCLGMDESRKILYAGTYGGSIYKSAMPHIYPPLNLTGVKKENRSLLKVEYINILTWKANPKNVNIVNYRVYQVEGGVWIFLDEVNASTFEYWQRNVEKSKEYTYAVVAVNEAREEGLPAYTTVK